MGKFVQINHMRWVPVDRVKVTRPVEGNANCIEILVDSDWHKVLEEDWLLAVCQTTPAQPNWWVVSPVRESDGTVREVTQEPVIAWLLAGQYPTPITVGAVRSDGAWIRRPDGTFEHPDIGEYATLEALLDHLNGREQPPPSEA